MAALLADLVLALHLAVIAFNVFGLIAVPLGAWRGWAFVRVFWWRALHLVSLAVVALQAALGEACFLTVWQREFEGEAGETASTRPMIQAWIESLIFWPLPFAVFAVAYATVLAYAIFLWIRVRPRRRFPTPS
jgi:hypothetical protein